EPSDYVSSEDRRAAHWVALRIRNGPAPPYPGGVTSFAARLASAVEEKGAPLCVGIDPDPALMPAGVGVREFCRGIVDAVAPVAVVVKPQTAFYEQYGAEGWAALRDVCDYAREAGLLVLVD